MICKTDASRAHLSQHAEQRMVGRQYVAERAHLEHALAGLPELLRRAVGVDEPVGAVEREHRLGHGIEGGVPSC
jgi:hypothetical protein